MFEALIAAASFVGPWVGYYRWAKYRKGKSAVVSFGGGFLLGCIGFIIAMAILVPAEDRKAPQAVASTPPVPLTPAQEKQQEKEARKKQLEKLFSAWDGSHRGLEAVIKKAMNDPDSYQHDETVFWDMDDHLVVRTTYRGKNAFGGVVKAWVKAKVSLTGEVLAIIETND